MPVVGEADEAQIADVGERVQIEIGETDEQRREHRQEKEYADDQQRRRDERPRGALDSHGAAPRSASQRRFSRIASTV